MKAVIIGAGPAGLTAAYELLNNTDITPIVFEETDAIGGISQTIQYKGNRMDIGGHRFFSKNDEIMQWWLNIMPIQGSPALDDILLNKEKALSDNGPDPQKEDKVMLVRERVSRIFFLRTFFDYPISLKWSTFSGMGLKNTIKAGFGYLWSVMHKLPETSLENFYINRFGRPLYEMFFEDYTEKVWGVHPSLIGADWGAQRVKGLSIKAVLKDLISRPFRSKNINQKNVETSLIEQFIYPKYGPGQLWEIVADKIKQKGGEIRMNSKVTGINITDGKIQSVDISSCGNTETVECDYLFSSMPIRDLFASFKGVTLPENLQRIASGLPYRDFITVGILAKQLKIKNKTKSNTYANRVPDTWIYVQERNVKVGRLQIFNNWSPYMVADYENTMFVGMEYFCTEGDEMWNMNRDEFIRMAIDELVSIDIIDKEDVLDTTYAKIKKAYPAYFGTYKEFDKLKEYLDTIPNLYCVGRNGQHRYNNTDHSMLTSIEAVRNIKNNISSKNNIWNVNTEKEYHETK